MKAILGVHRNGEQFVEFELDEDIPQGFSEEKHAARKTIIEYALKQAKKKLQQVLLNADDFEFYVQVPSRANAYMSLGRPLKNNQKAT